MLTPRQANIAAAAGPKNWGFLISGDHADTHPEAASPLLDVAFRQSCNTLESTFTALSGLAGAALILAHRNAAYSTRNALDVFRGCRRTANDLEDLNGHTPVGYQDAITSASKILYGGDPTALAMLLIDVIRVANHITKEQS